MDVESDKEENHPTIASPYHDAGPKGMSRKKKICIWSSIAFAVINAILFTILGLTVFKVKKPVTTVKSISLEHFNLVVDNDNRTVDLDVTLLLNLTIKNPNSVGFKYSNSTMILEYRDQEVGSAPFPAGKIGSHETAATNLSLTLISNRLLTNTNLYKDVISGSLAFTTYIKLTGKVKLLFKFTVKIYTTCDIDIDIYNKKISNISCHYKTKL